MIYRLFSKVHRALYEHRVLKKIKLNKPVMSIGNLSMGGTGKTPLTLFLYDELVKRNKRPAIICRSYRASLRESKVVPCDADPRIFGDEAVFFKMKKPQAVVISGPVKLESARQAEKMESVDVILVDDGFQHHKLYKDWNGIVLDLSKRWNQFYREGWEALKYANCVFLSKGDGVTHLTQVPHHLPQFRIETSTKPLDLHKNKYLLVSAIGNPQQLINQLNLQYPNIEFQESRFSDHHQYTQEEITKIEKIAHDDQFSKILCTEKDFVKIKNLKFNSQIWNPIEQQIQLEPLSLWQNYFQKVCQELKI